MGRGGAHLGADLGRADLEADHAAIGGVVARPVLEDGLVVEVGRGPRGQGRGVEGRDGADLLLREGGQLGADPGIRRVELGVDLGAALLAVLARLESRLLLGEAGLELELVGDRGGRLLAQVLGLGRHQGREGVRAALGLEGRLPEDVGAGGVEGRGLEFGHEAGVVGGVDHLARGDLGVGPLACDRDVVRRALHGLGLGGEEAELGDGVLLAQEEAAALGDALEEDARALVEALGQVLARAPYHVVAEEGG